MRIIVYNKIYSRLHNSGINIPYDFEILFDKDLIVSNLGDILDQLKQVDIDISQLTLEKWKVDNSKNIIFMNMTSLHNQEDEIEIIRKSSFSKINI